MAYNLNLTAHLKCGICKNIYKDPQQLCCLHSFCKRCIDQLERNDDGQVNCTRCGQLRGASQNKQDDLLQSLKDLQVGERKVICREHKKTCENFCKTCGIITCEECLDQEHKTCLVIHGVPENMKDIFSTMSATICQIAKDYNTTTRTTQDKMVQEQQNLHQQKAENSTKISKFFGSLKTKFMEHLARQEQKLQDETNKYYLKKEDLIGQKIQQCRSITERLENNTELIHSLQRVQTSMLHLQVAELMKIDLETCESKLPTEDNNRMLVCLDEAKINALFDLIPCNLKFSDEQSEITIGASADETATKYTSGGFMSAPSDNMPHKSSTVHGQKQTESSGYLPEGSPNNAFQHVEIDKTPLAPAISTAPPYPRTTDSSDAYHTSTTSFPDNRSKKAPTIERIDTLDAEGPQGYFEYGDHVTGFKSYFAEDETKTKAPVGMTWIDGNRILLVDRFNRKLKLVNEDGSPISITEVKEGDPWDVVYTSRKTNEEDKEMHFCAVSVPMAKTVLYVCVTDHIETIRKIKTSSNYCSLGHDKSGHTLVCGICPPFGSPAIHIINSEGAIIKEFALDSLGQPLFEYPRSIDVTPDGEIIVCDWKRRRLLFLRNDGYILGEYRGSKEHALKEPIGTTLDGLGNILVADTATHSIQTISVKDQQFVSYVKLSIETNPREITMTSPGSYPKIAVVPSNSVVIFDLWCSNARE